jgi:hypothetical protein
MSILHRAAAALAALAACVLAQPSQATTLFGDRAAFLNAVGPVTTLDFNGTAGASDTEVSRGPTWSYSGVGFSTANVIFSMGANDGFPASSAYRSDFLEWQDSSQALSIVLPGPVSAVGFDYMELRGHQDTFTITAANTQVATGTAATPLFIGLITDVPFTSFTIIDQGDPAFDFATIDNLSFGLTSAQPVPEPAPIAMLGTALLLLLPLHRRLRSTARQLAPPPRLG